MVSALRALIAITPAIFVLASIFFMSSDTDLGSAKGTTVCAEDDCVSVQLASAQDQARVHRLALKTETAIDMLDGRLSVDDAAARFLELSASDPESLEHMRQSCSGATDEEKALDQLLAFARVQAVRQPKRFAAAFEQAKKYARSNELDQPTPLESSGSACPGRAQH